MNHFPLPHRILRCKDGLKYLKKKADTSKMSITTKRILKEIKLIQENKDELESRGIYFYVNDHNIYNIEILIIPKDKSDLVDKELISPYTGGFFLFKLVLLSDFPLSPPFVEFNPKQGLCRLHPNYYVNGKICLSVINTWGEQDWVPSTSLISLANIFEERLNERSLCFEPGNEVTSNQDLKDFNMILKYAINKVAVLDVLNKKYKNLYEHFEDIIRNHWKNNKNEYMTSLKSYIDTPKAVYTQKVYRNSILVDFKSVIDELSICV